MTRLLAALTTALLLFGLGVGVPAANAGDVAACGDQLAQLSGDEASVPISGGKVDKERTGLVKLVEDATTLAHAGKTDDAGVKLTNLQTKVDDLATTARITTESAGLLTNGIAAATACLEALQG